MMADAGVRVTLRRGEMRHAGACAEILQRWLDGEAWMPDLHEAEATAAWMCGTTFAACEVTVAVADAGAGGGADAGSGAGRGAGRGDEVLGYLARRGREVRSFAVAEGWRGRGIGTRLLESAKDASPEGLELRTFVANAGALAFYRRHGFVETGRTEGDNEEGLPDILLRWEGRR